MVNKECIVCGNEGSFWSSLTICRNCKHFICSKCAYRVRSDEFCPKCYEEIKEEYEEE